ncbi:hypothetical protein [Chitinimonas taiwanensis]|uniref:hypothetical protein n=1 Tax=Chitinimonas taiwanensis TaxID=240412 RepID=UPI0035B1D3F0
MRAGWYRLELGDALSTPGEIALLAAQCQALRLSGQAGAAIYTRQCGTEGLHCRVEAYFSPALAELARKLGALPCRAPALAELVCICGG